jgi:predicted glycosyltransferase
MRILVEVHHPAHIHFFKHPVRIWQERGHDVLVAGRRRGIMGALASVYEWLPYRAISTMARNNRFPIAEFTARQLRMVGSILGRRPQVVASVMGSYAQGAGLLFVPNVIFTDSEHQALNHRIAHPFATEIHTPQCFTKDLGTKQVRYAGYHELSFLHPNRFQADPNVLSDLGLAPRSYVIVRLSAFNTLHDVGHRGVGSTLRTIVDLIQPSCRVLLVPEGDLPAEFEDLRLRCAPHLFHDLIQGARFVVTEGASTASEAACLGVPAVYVNPIALGYLEEQEERYGLVSNFREPQPAMERIQALLASAAPIEAAAPGHRRLLTEHIDVAAYVADQIERVGSRRG